MTARGSSHKDINVALIGTGYMGDLHARGYTLLPSTFPGLGPRPRLDLVIDIDEHQARMAKEQYGFRRWSTNWQDVLSDDIDVVDICAPNHLHEEIAVASLSRGKHVSCEKPLGRTLGEAQRIATAARLHPHLVTLVGFNNRFIPALAHAQQLISTGALGTIRHFRGTYLSDWAASTDVPLSWRFSKALAGSGVLGDVGSHLVDTARFLLGDEVANVPGAMLATLIPERRAAAGGTFRNEGKAQNELKPVDVDDEFAALLRFRSGATGVIEGSRVATGHGAEMTLQIEGTDGGIRFSGSRLNELEVWQSVLPETERGRTLVMTGPAHPYYKYFSPLAGAGIGFADTIVIELASFLGAIAGSKEPTPSFQDGLIVEQVLRDIEQAAVQTPSTTRAPRP